MLGRLSLNAFATYAGSIVSRLATLALAAAIARVGGEAAFGRYCFALVLMDCGLRVAVFGTDILVIRAIAAGAPEAREDAGRLLAWRLALAAPLYVALLAAAWALDADPETLRLAAVMGCGAIAVSLANLHLAAIQGRERLDLHVMVESGSLLAGVALGAMALRFGLGLAGVGAAYAARSVMMLAWAAWVCRRLGLPLRPQAGWRRAASLLRAAAPIGLNRLVTSAYLASGLFVLARLHGADAAGRFAGPMKIFEAAAMLGALMMTAAFPTLSRLTRESPGGLRGIVTLLARLLSWAGLALAVGGALHAGTILRLAFGPDFTGDPAALRLLLAAVPLSLNFVLVERLAYAAHEQARVFTARVAGLLANLAVLLVLAPGFGYLAAAAGVLLAELTMFVILYGGWRRYVPDFSFVATAGVPLAWTLAWGLAATLLPGHLAAWLRGALFAVPCALAAGWDLRRVLRTCLSGTTPGKGA